MAKEKTSKVLVALLILSLALLVASLISAVRRRKTGGWFWAANRGNLDEIKRLLDGGADVNQRTTGGQTALHLISGGGSIPAEPIGFFFFAVQKLESRMVSFSVCAEIAEFLIARGADVNAKSRSGYTALHNAAQANNDEVAKILIANGAGVNAQDNFQRTPLHFAARMRGFEVAKLLIENGAEVNCQDDLSRTPLHRAVTLGNEKLVGLLLRSGADVNLRDNLGKTGLDRARETNLDEIVLLLEKYKKNHD